jgi:hypothetical protein
MFLPKTQRNMSSERKQRYENSKKKNKNKKIFRTLLLIILSEPFNAGHNHKKSLKIPKGYSESVNRRRTDNAIAKRKKYKRTNNDLQNIHIKQ